MSNTVYSARNLSFSYLPDRPILRKINLDIFEGEFVAIIGLSGSGKTSLLRCLNRLVEPTAGHLNFFGQDITHLAEKKLSQTRRQIGMIFQQFNLVERVSVEKNVLFGRLAHYSLLKTVLGAFIQSDRQMAQGLLTKVGLSSFRETPVNKLSGGQQQRVAIARTLIQQPKVILADEPVASLDPVVGSEIMTLLKSIQNDLGLTIICNLHQLDLVQKFATRVIALNAGQLVYDGLPQNLTEHAYRAIYDSTLQGQGTLGATT